MSELVWEDPPKARRYNRAGEGKHAAIAAKLKENPGKWAKVFASASHQSARTMAHVISHAVGMKAYMPAGSFEAVSRKVGDETCVYARYVGGESDG